MADGKAAAAANALEKFLGPEPLAHLAKPDGRRRSEGASDEMSDYRSKVVDAAKDYLETHQDTLSNRLKKKIQRNITKYEDAEKWSNLGAQRTVWAKFKRDLGQI